MTRTRQQLSMFVPSNAATDLERVRCIVDPVQSSLIPTHVTLRREDELTDFTLIRPRLQSLHMPPVVLSFGSPEVFDE